MELPAHDPSPNPHRRSFVVLERILDRTGARQITLAGGGTARRENNTTVTEQALYVRLGVSWSVSVTD